MLKLITPRNRTHNFKHEKEVQFQLESLDGTYRTQTIHVSSAPEISGPIHHVNLNPGDYPHLKDIEFTEMYPMTEDTDQIVDVMIGEPLYSEILEGTPIRRKIYGEPVSQKTELRYDQAGAIPDDQCEVPQVLYSCCTSLPPVEQLIQKFWDLEDIESHPQKN